MKNIRMARHHRLIKKAVVKSDKDTFSILALYPPTGFMRRKSQVMCCLPEITSFNMALHDLTQSQNDGSCYQKSRG